MTDQKILKYTPKDVEFNNLSFLARPLRLNSKDDQRFHTNHIRVEEDRSAVSTNGSILCLVNRVPLVKGFYKPLKVHKNLLQIQYVGELNQFDYPDYKDIVGEAAKMDGKMLFIKIDREDERTFTKTHCKIIRAMKENCIDIKLLEVLTTGSWKAEIREEHACYFSQDDRVALIMPMRT